MSEKDYIDDLTKYVNMLHEASFFNYEFMKKQAIHQINNNFPDIAKEVLGEWRKRYPDGGAVTHKYHNRFFDWMPIRITSDIDLYLYVINNRINQYYNWAVASTAVHKLFFQSQSLPPHYVLYEEDDRKLTVSDFLSVLSHGKKFAETFFGIDSTKVNEYVLAIRTVHLAINHQEVNYPINKTLHTINDVLVSFAQDLQRNKDEKRTLGAISSLVDLTIDFLVER
jgi:hypothetical protein